MKVFTFDVDEEFARANNEFIRNTRQFRVSGILLGILAVIGVIYVYFGPGEQSTWALMVLIVGVLLGAAFAAAGIAAGKSSGKAQEMYDRSPLVPAVVAEVQEKNFLLLALVNTNVDPELPPRWGLAAVKVSAIPGLPTPPQPGTKIPCAALHGQRTSRDKDHWQSITPMPIAWGTPDEELVTFARKSIPNDQWNKLDNNRNKLEDVKASADNLVVL